MNDKSDLRGINARQRLLLITDRSPWPPDTGDRQRSALLFRAMQRIAPTDLLLVLDPKHLSRGDGEDSATAAIQLLRDQFNLIECARPAARGEKGHWRLLRPLGERLVDRVAHNIGNRRIDYAPDPAAFAAFRRVLADQTYAAVIGRYLLPTVKAGVLAPGVRRLPLVLDVDDLDTEVYRSRLGVPGLTAWKRVALRRHLNQIECIVANLLPKFDHVWVPSRADVRLVEQMNPRVSVLPNIPYTIPDQPLAAAVGTCPVLVTVGSWTHRANVEGVEHFIRNHWTSIRHAAPRAIYRIVGSGMSAELRARWGSVEGVEPIGHVDDLRETYSRAAASVVPIYEGGGTKIKLLESLAFGRAAIVTPHALRGYEHLLLDRDSLLVAHRDEEFPAACVELLANPELRNNLACRGSALVRKHFSADVVADQIRLTLTGLCPSLFTVSAA